MKKYFYMLPRCSSKTTMACGEFVKDPSNTLFVVENSNLKDYVYDIIGFVHKNVITCNRFKDFIVSRRFKTILLDEYLFFSNYREIYETISNMPGIENLYIYTTSNKCYNILFFDYIKKCKTANISYEYLVRDRPIIHEKLCELYYNFITDPDTNIIDNIPTVFHIKPERFRFNNNEQYDVEFLNKWLSDNCFDLNIMDSFFKTGQFKNIPLCDMPKDINKFTVQKDGRLLIENLVRPLRIKKSNGDDIILADYGDEFYIYYGDRCYSVKNGKIELF